MNYLSALLSVFLLVCFCCGGSIQAQIPKTSQIQAVAIYNSLTSDDNLPDGSVNYNISNPATIAILFTNIESNVLRDCTNLDSDSNAYVYVKYIDGTRDVYDVFLMWSHIALRDNGDNCYYIESSAQSLFESLAQ